ncbi:MAG: hypothetical protein Q7S33_00455 [Nanoarchaeota archaeon]|nr:hypothetical protein [Nanoarchaeota archaeon]
MSIRDVDHIKPVVDYIKRNMHKGYDLNSLKWALIKQGHSKTEVERALSIAKDEFDRERPRQSEPAVQIEEPKTEVIPDEKKGMFKRLWDWL